MGLATRLAASVYHDNETGGDVYAISDTILSTEHSLSRLSIDSREDNPIVYYNIAIGAHDGEGSLEVGHVLLDGSVFTVNQTSKMGSIIPIESGRQSSATFNLNERLSQTSALMFWLMVFIKPLIAPMSLDVS